MENKILESLTARLGINGKDTEKVFIEKLNTDLEDYIINSNCNKYTGLLEKNKKIKYEYKNDEQLKKILFMKTCNLIIEDFGNFFDNEVISHLKKNIERNNPNSFGFKKIVGVFVFACDCIDEKLFDAYLFMSEKEINKIIKDAEIHAFIKKNKKIIDKLNSMFNGISSEDYIKFFSQRVEWRTGGFKIKFSNDVTYEFSKWEKGGNGLKTNFQVIEDLLEIEDTNEFDLSGFMNFLSENNPKKYLQVCGSIEKMVLEIEYGKICLDHGYPLFASTKEGLEITLLANTYLFNTDYTKELNDKNLILYPMYVSDKSEKLEKEGKKAFKNFLSKYFEDEEKAMEIISDPESIIQDKDDNRKELRSKDTFEFVHNWYSYRGDIDASKFCEGFYDDKMITKRFFITCGFFYEFLKEDSDSFFWNKFHFGMERIEEKYHLKLIHQNKEDFISVLKKLNENLADYGIKVNDNEYTPNYLISLMDYGFADAEQKSKFAELEQLGDAVYTVALAALAYHNAEAWKEEGEYPSSLISMAIYDSSSAKYQIKIADELHIPDMYLINKVQKAGSDENLKFKDNAEVKSHFDEKNYYADSYEMLIGSVCKEYGLGRAYQFALDTIKKAYPDSFGNAYEALKAKADNTFTEWVKSYFGDCDHTEVDYFRTVLPGKDLLLNFPYEYELNYHSLIYAFEKLFPIMLYGNDTKEKRTLVSDHSTKFNDINSKNMKVIIYKFFNEGIDEALKACNK